MERRSFIRNAGAALSATVVADTAAAPAKPAIIEAIRLLQHDFIGRLNSGRFAQVPELFAPDAEVHLWGGVFLGKESGIRRLYTERFGRPVQTYLLSHAPHLDALQVAPDGMHVLARWHCAVRTEAPASGPPTLVAMARQQGEGTFHWWESGVFESTCSRVGDTWRVSRLAYLSLGEVDPALNLRCGKPHTVPAFTRCYPHNPTGPDRLLS